MKGYVKKCTGRIPTQSTIKTIWCTYKIPHAGIWTEGTVWKSRWIKTIVTKTDIKFLYSSQTIDNIMQHALDELCIATLRGTQETQETQEALEYFLN